MNYKYNDHGIFFNGQYKHRKLIVIKQPKGCKFMRKCSEIRVASGLRPAPLGERISSPRPIAAIEDCLLGGEGNEGKGRRGEG